MHFKHPYASDYRRRTIKKPDGTLHEVLTITPTIELRSWLPDFDTEKETKLIQAAVDYAKPRGIASIEFEVAERA